MSDRLNFGLGFSSVYHLVRPTTTNESGGSDSSWNEEANRERLEAAALVNLNLSDGGGSVGVGVC